MKKKRICFFFAVPFCFPLKITLHGASSPSSSACDNVHHARERKEKRGVLAAKFISFLSSLSSTTKKKMITRTAAAAQPRPLTKRRAWRTKYDGGEAALSFFFLPLWNGACGLRALRQSPSSYRPDEVSFYAALLHGFSSDLNGGTAWYQVREFQFASCVSH